MMKVDETQIPEHRKFKVRCPRCQHVDVVEGPSLASEETARPPVSEPAKETIASVQPYATPDDPERQSDPQRCNSDVHFPADAEEVKPQARQLMSRKTRLICWAVGSLAWVLFFALLVNLILPGPYGGRPVTGLPPQEEVDSPLGTGFSPQTSGKSNLKTPPRP